MSHPESGKLAALLQRFLRQFDLDLFPVFILNVEIGFNEYEFDRAIYRESRPFVTLVPESEVGFVDVCWSVYDVMNDWILAANNRPVHTGYTGVPTLLGAAQGSGLPRICRNLGSKTEGEKHQDGDRWRQWAFDIGLRV